MEGETSTCTQKVFHRTLLIRTSKRGSEAQRFGDELDHPKRQLLLCPIHQSSSVREGWGVPRAGMERSRLGMVNSHKLLLPFFSSSIFLTFMCPMCFLLMSYAIQPSLECGRPTKIMTTWSTQCISMPSPQCHFIAMHY